MARLPLLRAWNCRSNARMACGGVDTSRASPNRRHGTTPCEPRLLPNVRTGLHVRGGPQAIRFVANLSARRCGCLRRG